MINESRSENNGNEKVKNETKKIMKHKIKRMKRKQ